KRLTPSRCALESRPLREEDAPFLCAIGCLLPRVDAGDLQRCQLLTVTLALVVAGLVAELVNDDLGALAVVDDLGGHAGLRERGSVGGDGLAVDEEQCGQRDRVAGA